MRDMILDKLDSVVEVLYQQDINKGYSELGMLLGAINDALQSGELNVELEAFNVVLRKAMEALEEKDMVLVADILNYELREFLV